MKNVLFLLTLCSLLLDDACNKDDDQPTEPQPKNELPPATQTGANTFGCIVNDTTVWGAEFFPAIWSLNGDREVAGGYSKSTGYTWISVLRLALLNFAFL